MSETLYYVHSFIPPIILLFDLNFGNAIKHESTLVNTKYAFLLEFFFDVSFSKFC